LVDRDVEVVGNLGKHGLDSGGREGAHHGVEGNHGEVQDFLRTKVSCEGETET
jgi:hypothetical protein